MLRVPVFLIKREQTADCAAQIAILRYILTVLCKTGDERSVHRVGENCPQTHAVIVPNIAQMQRRGEMQFVYRQFRHILSLPTVRIR